jgi:hypothetical protein
MPSKDGADLQNGIENFKLNDMIQALAISSNTMIRAAVIGSRTGSDFMAGAKSAMIEALKQKMRGGVAHFLFLKKSGEVREAWGTVNSTLAAKHTNGRGESRENFMTTAFFDVELGQWRSFRWESLVWVE